MIKHIKKGLLMAGILAAVLSFTGCPKEAGGSGVKEYKTLSLDSIQGTWNASVPSNRSIYYGPITISGNTFKFESEYSSWEAEIKTFYPKEKGEGYIIMQCTNDTKTPSNEDYPRVPYYMAILISDLTADSFKLGLSYGSDVNKFNEFTIKDDTYAYWLKQTKNENAVYTRQ